MSEWGWVLWGYGVALGAIFSYAWSIGARRRRVEQVLDDMAGQGPG